MAKDPAFLFYPNDWLGGTMGMSFEEKGAYMELLMMQFNRGHMTQDMIGRTVGRNWDAIKHKFKIDENSLWFNERLDIEKDKRKAYVQSRKNNKNGSNQHSKKEGHMSNHMDNENVVVDDTTKKEEISAVENFEKRSSEPENWKADCSKFLNDKEFKVQFSRTKNISYEETHKRVRDFILDLHLQENYMSIQGMKKYFVNSYNKWVENNGKSKNNISSNAFIQSPTGIDYENLEGAWNQ